jgi:DNA-binding response OmpR family regulator
MSISLLVVDDNRDAADSLALLLGLSGYHAAVAYDGNQALAVALVTPPALMLIDLAMPQFDGYALAREVREHAALAATVLAAVTGYADAAHRARAVEAGYQHFLVKPIDFAALQTILRSCWRT